MASSNLTPVLRRHAAWLLVGLTLLFVLVVRVRLRDMPLERDEGEYAYAGQLILQGVPPYKEACNMKLPGTYAAYAVIMTLFGQSPAGIHLGLALVNAASIALVFLIGRRLLDPAAGVAAAVAFALMTLSPTVLGLAGHATHFVTFFALAGLWALLHIETAPAPRPPDPPSHLRTFLLSHLPTFAPSHLPTLLPVLAGLCFGLAFLMKQHGIFFIVFGALFLLWRWIEPRLPRDPRKVDPKIRWKARAQREAIFTSEPVPERARPRSGARTPAPAAPVKRLSLIAQAKAASEKAESAEEKAESRKQKAEMGQQSSPDLPTFAPSHLPTFASSHLPTSAPSHLPTFPPSHLPTSLPPSPAVPVSPSASPVSAPVKPAPQKFISQSSPVSPPPPLLPTRTFLKQAALFSIAAVVPYLLTCLILWLAGVFPQFWFWTVTYAAKYASAMPLADGPALLRNALRTVVGPNLVFWILPWAGLVVLWWDWRLKAQNRFLLCALLVCSLASASVGLYFRGHYFIPVLPVLGLLIGVAVSRAVWLLRHDRTLELMLAFPILLLFAAGIIVPLSGHGALWFTATPEEAVRRIYSTTLLKETAAVADFIRTNTPAGARVAVLGSEPQIYFLSRRRSATGHIYTYALMERQPYARKMQDEMIAEIERNRPQFIVYVEEPYSWLRQDWSDPRLFDWWQDYWPRELTLVKTVPIETELEDRVEAVGTNIQVRQGKRIRTGQLLVFQRKAQDPGR
jgi:hypothetical protein